MRLYAIDNTLSSGTFKLFDLAPSLSGLPDATSPRGCLRSALPMNDSWHDSP